MPSRRRSTVRDRIVVANSGIHGSGVYAARKLRSGARIIEYTGERISQDEGARRYNDEDGHSVHVLLFTVDDDTVIDAARGGNESRFINHSCDPNCEAVEDGGRIFIEALRTIQPGEELTYDYRLDREDADSEEIQAHYPCRCGAANCRGTLLAPPP